MSQIPAKLDRLSDDSYKNVQKAQRVRESYGDIVDCAINTLLEKEGQCQHLQKKKKEKNQ
jgi:hypothetical protein